jgi:hypothetical protein
LLEYAPVLSSGPAFENGCKYIDEYLEKRTFLVGYSLSIADVTIMASLAGKNILRYLFNFTCNVSTRWILNNLIAKKGNPCVSSVFAFCGYFLVCPC